MTNVLYTKNSKSLLAKMMAEEDITIQHKNIDTAYFDIKNRILAVPIWKDMSDDLYDLFMGHEVGHALYTPSDTDILQDIAHLKNKQLRIDNNLDKKYFIREITASLTLTIFATTCSKPFLNAIKESSTINLILS